VDERAGDQCRLGHGGRPAAAAPGAGAAADDGLRLCASNFAYALVGSALRHWLAQGRRLLWFNRALAAVLVATAAWMSRL
jgi:hypothetical protein